MRRPLIAPNPLFLKLSELWHGCCKVAAVRNKYLRKEIKRSMKTKTLIPVLVLSAAAVVPATSMAGTATANIGWSSDYIFRGIFQNSSSAYAGVDYTTDSGFYVGNWDADVGLGLENDLYFGYSAGRSATRATSTATISTRRTTSSTSASTTASSRSTLQLVSTTAPPSRTTRSRRSRSSRRRGRTTRSAASARISLAPTSSWVTRRT